MAQQNKGVCSNRNFKLIHLITSHMKFAIVDNAKTNVTDDVRVLLTLDNWNDFHYKTSFHLTYLDSNRNHINIGNVRIGFKGQDIDQPTCDSLPKEFTSLDEKSFFSLGCEVDYYTNLSKINSDDKNTILNTLNDIVNNPLLIRDLELEDVFIKSLLRGSSVATIRGQYDRALKGLDPLSSFKFTFLRTTTEDMGGLKLTFSTKAHADLSSNVHAIIGSNGTGKTTILKDFIKAEVESEESNVTVIKDLDSISNNNTPYFSSIVFASFSIFDNYPEFKSGGINCPDYHFIGLSQHTHNDLNEYSSSEICKGLIECFAQKTRSQHWLEAIDDLLLDFKTTKLVKGLYDDYKKIYSAIERAHSKVDHHKLKKRLTKKIQPLISGLSSGHSVSLLLITQLVAHVDERTLVLLDEPESHLHPPLISSLTKAISSLLWKRNGIAIFSTHSPVILQDIPRSCVWKLYRVGNFIEADRPKIDTFGSNIGELTHEIFGLEVKKSGYYAKIVKDVESGLSYDEVIAKYENQLGAEGRTLLATLISERDK